MSRTARDRPNRESPTSNHGPSPLLAALPWIVFAFLTLVSWQRWIEPWVDAGRELMVPSRVAQGERLYRDVRFYYGPLAPYLAAGVERAAPQSLPARILLSAAVALLHVEALRRLAFRALPARRAALAVSLAVAIGFFLWPGGCHLFPYSLDTSIAVAAATFALVSASRPEADAAVSVAFWLFAALTSRPEIGLAAAAFVVITPVPRERGTRFAPPLLRAAGASVAAAAAVYAFLSRGTPLATLRQEGWLAFVSVPQEFRNVYLSFAGLDRPALRLSELAIAVLLLLVVAGGLALLAYAARAGGTRAATAATAAAAAALTLVALACLRPPAFLEAPLSLLPPMVRPLPLFVIAGALWRAGTRLAGTRDRGIFEAVPDGLLLLAGLFAARLVLAAGYVGPYDAFFLPLPVVAGCIGLYGLSDRIARRPELPAFSRLITATLSVFLAFRCAERTVFYRAPGWTGVDTPAGRLFLREPYADATRDALAFLERHTGTGGTIVGFPEVGFLQYVLGRRSGLPEDQFFPGHLDANAERRAVARLRQAPPDAFVYVNVLTAGHGARAFGRDYLRELDAAVHAASTPVAAFGPGARNEAAIGDPGFFIEVRAPLPKTSR